MFHTLLRLFNQGVIGEEGLRNAVEKKWITEEEFEGIIGNPS